MWSFGGDYWGLPFQDLIRTDHFERLPRGGTVESSEFI